MGEGRICADALQPRGDQESHRAAHRPRPGAVSRRPGLKSPMAPRTQVTKRSSASIAALAKRHGEHDRDSRHRTSARAPSEAAVRMLKSSVGFEVRRLRKSLELTVTEL